MNELANENYQSVNEVLVFLLAQYAVSRVCRCAARQPCHVSVALLNDHQVEILLKLLSVYVAFHARGSGFHCCGAYPPVHP